MQKLSLTEQNKTCVKDFLKSLVKVKRGNMEGGQSIICHFDWENEECDGPLEEGMEGDVCEWFLFRDRLKEILKLYIKEKFLSSVSVMDTGFFLIFFFFF